MIAAGTDPDVISYNMRMIVQGAKPDVINYCVVMQASAKSNDPQRAVSWLDWMNREGLEASHITYNLVIDARAKVWLCTYGNRVQRKTPAMDAEHADFTIFASLMPQFLLFFSTFALCTVAAAY